MIKVSDTVLYCLELTWGQKQLHYVRIKKSDVDKFESIENELRDIYFLGSSKDRYMLETFETTYSSTTRSPFSDVYKIDESDAEGFDYRIEETDEDDEYEPEHPDVFLTPGKEKSKLVRIKIES